MRRYSIIGFGTEKGRRIEKSKYALLSAEGFLTCTVKRHLLTKSYKEGKNLYGKNFDR
jgi:hypothetical protein